METKWNEPKETQFSRAKMKKNLTNKLLFSI